MNPPGTDPIPADEIEKALVASRDLVLRYIPVPEPAEPTPQPGFEISKRSVFYTLFRHPFKIVACFAIFSAAALVYVVSQPNLYVSEALIRIRGQRNNMLIDPAAGEGSLLKSTQLDQNLMSAELDLIQSDGLLMRVVDKLGPDRILDPQRTPPDATPGLKSRFYRLLNFDTSRPEPRQAALLTLKKNLKAWSNSGVRDLVHVEFKSEAPARAQAVLNAIVDEYQSYHIASNRSRFSPEFFAQKAVDVQKRLEEAKAELDRQRRELKITMPETEKELLLKQLSTIDAAIVEAQGGATAATETIRVLDGFSKRYEAKTGRKPRVTNPVALDMQRKLIDLQAEEARLTSKYSDTHPLVREARAQIASVKSALKAAEAGGDVDPMTMLLGMNDPQFALSIRTETARADQAAMGAKMKLLASQKALIESRLDNLLEHETALKTLEQRVDRLGLEYRQYLSSQQAAEIARTLDQDLISNVTVDQAATLPFVSTKSQRKMLALLALGLFMGLAAGVGWAFLIEYADSTLRTPADAEARLGLPVLIAIPDTRNHLLMIEGK
ncbi:MAG: GumC family protein [Candidatus Sumerlaeia bacterium]